MKKYILYGMSKHAWRNLTYRDQERWTKRIKYIAVFAIVGILLIGGLSVWGAVVVVNKVAAQLSDVTIQEKIVRGQEEVKSLVSQPLTTKDCLETLGSMLSPTKILTVPLTQNLESVRGACLGDYKNKNEIKKES